MTEVSDLVLNSAQLLHQLDHKSNMAWALVRMSGRMQCPPPHLKKGGGKRGFRKRAQHTRLPVFDARTVLSNHLIKKPWVLSVPCYLNLKGKMPPLSTSRMTFQKQINEYDPLKTAYLGPTANLSWSKAYILEVYRRLVFK